MIAFVALSLVAQTLPAPNVSPVYLAAWVLVAMIAGTPGVIATVLASRNRQETRQEIEQVRYQVMPNGGGSSFDLLHRLVWETHERTEPIPELVERVERLESTPCPYYPKES